MVAKVCLHAYTHKVTNQPTNKKKTINKEMLEKITKFLGCY